jgi:hypothetical protein
VRAWLIVHFFACSIARLVQLQAISTRVRRVALVVLAQVLRNCVPTSSIPGWSRFTYRARGRTSTTHRTGYATCFFLREGYATCLLTLTLNFSQYRNGHPVVATIHPYTGHTVAADKIDPSLLCNIVVTDSSLLQHIFYINKYHYCISHPHINLLRST